MFNQEMESIAEPQSNNNNKAAEEVVKALQPPKQRSDTLLRETLMNFKFKFAKLEADMLGMRAEMALMEDLAKAQNAENERLKQEMGAEISRLKRENDQMAMQIRLLRREIAGLKGKKGVR